MTKPTLIRFYILFIVFSTGYLLSSCSSSKPFNFAKGTGSFKDPYHTTIKPQLKTGNLTASATSKISASDLSDIIEEQVNGNTVVDNSENTPQKLILNQPNRRELKRLKRQLEAVLDTTKKKDQITVQTNEKKVSDLRNEVDSLKKSVKTEKDGDKVVVSFDKPQTNLSTEGKILIIAVAVLLLIALLSLPVIGPVLGVLLAIAVVAAALALVLGIVEIR